DLARLAEESPEARLAEHVVSSSGWEWGSWQNDTAALRMAYELPASWEELFEQMFAHHEDGRVADVLVDVVELQHELLLEKGLASFFVGRDQDLDASTRFVVPPRVTLGTARSANVSAVRQYQLDLIAPLEEYIAALDEAVAEIGEEA